MHIPFNPFHCYCQAAPKFGAWGSKSCSNGYVAITDEATCKSAAQASYVTFANKSHWHCKRLRTCKSWRFELNRLSGVCPLWLYAQDASKIGLPESTCAASYPLYVETFVSLCSLCSRISRMFPKSC